MSTHQDDLQNELHKIEGQIDLTNGKIANATQAEAVLKQRERDLELELDAACRPDAPPDRRRPEEIAKDLAEVQGALNVLAQYKKDRQNQLSDLQAKKQMLQNTIANATP